MKINKLYIIDSFMVFLNIANTYTIIPMLLFTPHIGINSVIIAFINMFFLLSRFDFKFKIPQKDILFYLYIVIYVSTIFIGLYTNTFAIGFLGSFISNVTFYIILYNLFSFYYKEYSFSHAMNFINRGYIWLCVYALFSTFSLVILIEIFNFNPLFNDVSNVYDIFHGNITRDISLRYYFPYNLSILITSDFEERISFLHKFGMVCGIFHEPHTMTFVVVPFFFLMFFTHKEKIIRIIISITFIFYLLIAASTTSFLSVFICLVSYFCFKYKKIILFILLIAIYISLELFSTENQIIELIRYKMQSGSADYSLSTIEFAFTPRTLFGTCFFDLSYLQYRSENYDVGYIIFVLNIIFLMIFIYKIFYLNLSDNKYIRMIGLFSLYFFLHSTKLALRNYSLSYLLFVMFIITKCYHESKLNKK